MARKVDWDNRNLVIGRISDHAFTISGLVLGTEIFTSRALMEEQPQPNVSTCETLRQFFLGIKLDARTNPRC